MSGMAFWRLSSYDGTPAANAMSVGSIVKLHTGVSPAEFDGGAIATHFNHVPGDWVSAKWVGCPDPRAARS